MLQIVKNVVGEQNTGGGGSVSDTVKPSINFIQPLNNDSLWGTITLKVNTIDNIGIQKVVFDIDGNSINIDSIAPYEFNLSTENYPGTHTFGAKAYDLSGNTSYSKVTVYVFGRPSPPILLTPVNNDTNVSINPKLIWSNSDWATEYIIEISTTLDFINPLISKTTPYTNEQINALSYNQEYYWRVKSKNKAYSSNFSEIFKFKTQKLTQFYKINKKLVDFGKVFINHTKMDSLVIENLNNDSITINIIPPGIPQFSINQTKLRIPPYFKGKFEIFFTPSNKSNYSTKIPLIIQTETIIETIMVTGIGIRPPKKTFPTQKIIIVGNPISGISDSVYIKNDGDENLIINDIQSSTNFIQIFPKNLVIEPQDSQYIYISVHLDSLNSNSFTSTNYAIFIDNTTTSPDTLEIIINNQTNVTIESPNNYILLQNYPNPFNSETTIIFNLAEKSHTYIKIFDILGKEVSMINNNILDAGTHTLKFNAENLASGIYYYFLYTNDKILKSNKMILMK
ncbi:MAG: Fibronectin type III domain protein [Ignavibacteriae bacterium]|nr:MAG: Fibronectin type III domain protein [Ignavibacteriota bacterium]